MRVSGVLQGRLGKPTHLWGVRVLAALPVAQCVVAVAHCVFEALCGAGVHGFCRGAAQGVALKLHLQAHAAGALQLAVVVVAVVLFTRPCAAVALHHLGQLAPVGSQGPGRRWQLAFGELACFVVVVMRAQAQCICFVVDAVVAGRQLASGVPFVALGACVKAGFCDELVCRVVLEVGVFTGFVDKARQSACQTMISARFTHRNSVP